MTKHYIGYGVAIAIALTIAFCWLRAHDAWKDMQSDIKVRDAQIKANQQTVKADTATFNAAQGTIDKATAANSAADDTLKRQLAGVQAQLDAKPNSEQVKQIIQSALPGVQTVTAHDDKGNAVIAVEDTQANRDVINQKDADFKACKFNLDDCETKQKNFETIIAGKDTQIQTQLGTITALNATIAAQNGTIKEQSRFGKGGNLWSRTGRVAIPIACAGLGAWSASQANAKPKTIGIAAGGAGAVCAFAFHF